MLSGEEPVAPLQGIPGPENAPQDPKLAYIEQMLMFRSAVCHEWAINADHNHCIGCTLVLDFMRKHYPNMKYGSKEQWEMESAFCMHHESAIIAEFIRQKEAEGVRFPTIQNR